MSNDLIQKNAELGRFLFCERYTLQPVKNAMYIEEGQDLKRGAVVDVNGVLVGTNSLMPYAVLENDCDTRAKGAFASVFVKGEFNIDKLFFADGLSKNDLDNIVYNGSGIGLVIKPYEYAEDFIPLMAPSKSNPLMTKEETASMINDAVSEVTLDPSAVALGNVHLLDEATEFSADAGVLVDSGTAGPKFMEASKLLELTAQNALAGNVAPEFIPSSEPNPTTTIAGYPYIYNGSLYVAKEDGYQGAWDGSKFDSVNLPDVFLQKNFADVERNKFVGSGNPILVKSTLGYKVVADGTEAVDNNYKLNTYDVDGLESVIIEVRIGESAYVGFYDNTDTLLVAYQGNSSAGINFKRTLDVPVGAVTMKVSIGIATTDYYFVGNSKSFLSRIENSVNDTESRQNIRQGLRDALYLTDVRRYSAVDSNGDYFYSEYYQVSVLSLQPCVHEIFVTARITEGRFIVFKDANGVVTGYREGATTTIGSRLPTLYNEKISVPEGSAIVEISHNTTAPFDVFSDSGEAIRLYSLNENYGVPRLLETLVGKTVRTNGNIESVASYNTAIYNVSGCKKFHVFGKIGANTCILFKNRAGGIVSYIGGNLTPNVYVHNFDTDVDVPSSAFTMLIGYGNNVPFRVSNATADKEVSAVSDKLNLAGKKVVFIGSSTTEGYGTTDGQNYVNIFANLTGCSVLNLGVASTCVANNTTNGLGSQRFVTRATSANLSDADLVVVQIASNDMSYDSKAIGPHFKETTITPSGNVGNKEIGAITDTDTFAGALHNLISTIQTNVPANTPVIVMTPHHVGQNVSTNPKSTQCNSHGDFITDFVDAIKDICSFYAVPVLDIYSMGSISKLTTNFAGLFVDGVHFNNDGHKWLAKLLVRFVKNNVVFL